MEWGSELTYKRNLFLYSIEWAWPLALEHVLLTYPGAAREGYEYRGGEHMRNASLHNT